MKTITQIKLLMVATAFVLLLVMPVELFHGLVWIVLHLYEFIEYALDEIIHHLFHTTRHTTQVIVFYLMLGLLLGVLYSIFRALRKAYYQMKFALVEQWPTHKQQAFYYWQDLSPDKKIKMVSTVTFGGACVALWVLI